MNEKLGGRCVSQLKPPLSATCVFLRGLRRRGGGRSPLACRRRRARCSSGAFLPLQSPELHSVALLPLLRWDCLLLAPRSPCLHPVTPEPLVFYFPLPTGARSSSLGACRARAGGYLTLAAALAARGRLFLRKGWDKLVRPCAGGRCSALPPLGDLAAENQSKFLMFLVFLREGYPGRFLWRVERCSLRSGGSEGLQGMGKELPERLLRAGSWPEPDAISERVWLPGPFILELFNPVCKPERFTSKPEGASDAASGAPNPARVPSSLSR